MKLEKLKKGIDSLKIKWTYIRELNNKVIHNIYIGDIKVASYYFDAKASVRRGRKVWVIESKFSTQDGRCGYTLTDVSEDKCRDKCRELIEEFKNKLLGVN